MISSYCVYEIVNHWNEKRYIGMTGDFNRRKQQHFSESSRKKDKKKLLYRVMKVFGDHKFSMNILLDNLTKAEAMFAESYLINNLPTFAPSGYNKAKESCNLKLENSTKIANPTLIFKLEKLLITKKNKELL